MAKRALHSFSPLRTVLLCYNLSVAFRYIRMRNSARCVDFAELVNLLQRFRLKNRPGKRNGGRSVEG